MKLVFFTGSGTQTISGTATAPFNIDYIVSAKASGSIQKVIDTALDSHGVRLSFPHIHNIMELRVRVPIGANPTIFIRTKVDGKCYVLHSLINKTVYDHYDICRSLKGALSFPNMSS